MKNYSNIILKCYQLRDALEGVLYHATDVVKWENTEVSAKVQFVFLTLIKMLRECKIVFQKDDKRAAQRVEMFCDLSRWLFLLSRLASSRVFFPALSGGFGGRRVRPLAKQKNW